MLFRLSVFVIILFSASQLCGQVNCLPNAHSHNDYCRKHPLLDALDHRFASIEADVFLIRGQLYVSHTYPFFGRQRLDSLYLEPLQRIFNERKGKIYDNGPLILLIDIKSDAVDTYHALEKLLLHYSAMLTSCADGTIRNGAVTVILSGNKPPTAIRNSTVCLTFIDQSLLSPDKTAAKNTYLMASAKYSSVVSWKGKGKIPGAERKKLETLVEIAHEQGKKVRLWASPENEIVWKFLLECGVDLINTDQLEELSGFLNKQNPKKNLTSPQ